MKFFLTIVLIFSVTTFAEEGHEHHDDSAMHMMDHMEHNNKHAPSPIGVMGNMHHKGFMLSIRHGIMQMEGNILDGDKISNSNILERPNEISSTPANLSVIPEDMEMSMTMIGGMYAPNNNITLMFMGTYLSKEMKLSSYSAMMDRDLIGQFNTSVSDLSNVTLSMLFHISDKNMSKWFGEISYQNSLGKNNDTGEALTPMGTRVEMTMPYAMQPSDQATRLILGFTNKRHLNEKITLGNQIRHKFVVSDKSWSHGNQTELNSWAQYQLNKSIFFSTRLKFLHTESISGRDPLISAPVQTANPENYGGKEVHFGVGVNFAINLFSSEGENIGLEITKPLIQDKNNLQMKTDYQVIVGYQKNF